MSDDLTCKECGATLLSEDELEEHLKQHERASDLFQCDKCKMTFKTKEELQRHIQAVHGSSA
jgi:zinc finger/BTB domain-containing protein 40